MALHWNIKNLADPESVKVYDEDGEHWHLNHKAHALVFATISVGIGTITEDNAAEFYARLHCVEGLHGPFCYSPDPVPELAQAIAAKVADGGESDEGAIELIASTLREAGVGGRDDRLKPFTIDEVRQHIGLYTNVSFEPREEWARRMIIGHGDRLADNGLRLMTDDEVERREQMLQKRADALYEAGHYPEAGRLSDQLDSVSVSVLDELARNFRANVEARS